MANAIQLFPKDNIVVLTQAITTGESVNIKGQTFAVTSSIGLGHKLACQSIAAGEKILKYGAPIGSALCDIKAGEHVHLHNMKSDYLPTFTLDKERKFTR